MSGFAGGVLDGLGEAPDAVFSGETDGVLDVLGDVVLGDVVLGDVVLGDAFCGGVLCGASSIEPLQASASVLTASQAPWKAVRRSGIEGEGRWDCRLKGTSRGAKAEIVYRPRPGFVPVRWLRRRPGPYRLL